MGFGISIDRERCMGSGNCVFHAPDTFDLDESSIAIVRDPAGGSEDAIVRAARGCPTQAIMITRDGERVV
jgi:ferredoxin